MIYMTINCGVCDKPGGICYFKTHLIMPWSSSKSLMKDIHGAVDVMYSMIPFVNIMHNCNISPGAPLTNMNQFKPSMDKWLHVQ